MKQQVTRALGLMSGTSLDGVDLVRVETDGAAHCRVEGRFYAEYTPDLRERLLVLAKGGDLPLNDVLRLERDLSLAYADAAAASGLLDGVEVVGCHGQTVRHIPAEGLTWQLGDANILAARAGVPVVMDFRRRDMAAGGQGAPLAPLFHAEVMMAGARGPWAVLNIGGVANVTYGDGKGGVSAADCGPGVGLLNTWVKEKTGAEFDRGGALAAAGSVDAALVDGMAERVGFWARPLPRSADRYEFLPLLESVAGLGVEDGAATLTAMSVAGIARTLRELGGDGIEGLYVSGGGALNPVLLEGLRADGWPVKDVEQATGWKPQDVEAACFAWLAVRRLRGLTTTLPATTGCRLPTVGGVLTA